MRGLLLLMLAEEIRRRLFRAANNTFMAQKFPSLSDTSAESLSRTSSIWHHHCSPFENLQSESLEASKIWWLSQVAGIPVEVVEQEH